MQRRTRRQFAIVYLQFISKLTKLQDICRFSAIFVAIMVNLTGGSASVERISFQCFWIRYPSKMISGAQIRAARALLGWSQDQLCHAAEVSERTLRAVEGEEGGSSLRSVRKLHDALEAAGLTFLATDAGIGVFLRRSNPQA
jgi:DNA-binding XRE family transcriptional regulator